MPVTKTAKRALRSSERKAAVNRMVLRQLKLALKRAKASKSEDKINTAISLADRAAKKRVLHKNKASRIKRVLSKLLPAKSKSAKTKLPKSKGKKAKKPEIKKRPR